MERFFLLALGALVALAISCGDDNPVKPIDDGNDTDTNPLFRVTVVDTAGNPVPGLRVGSFNRSPYEPDIHPWPLQFQSRFFYVDIPVAGRVVVTVLDYYRRLIDTTIDSIVSAGDFLVSWTPVGTDTIVPGGYYHLMVNKPIGDNQRTTEDIVMVWDWEFNPIFTIHGETDSSGTFESADTLLFPALLGAPPAYIPDPNRTGDTILSYYTDSLVIHLSHPDNVYYIAYYHVKLLRGANAFQLVWNPPE